jgi:ABC-type branched-subunit amino acid transport system ATPase component/ABC-type branched-subunit amino acid transport system permease subunit
MTAELAVDTPVQSARGPEQASRARRALLTPRRSNILLVLVAAVVLPTMTERAMPLLFTPDDALILAQAAAVAMAVLSLNMLTGYAGQVSLGQAALLAVGGFTDGLVTSRAGMPMWVGIPAAAATSALVALIIGFPALRLRGLYLAMVTIGFGYMMTNAILPIDFLTGGSAGVVMPRRIWGDHMLVDQADMLAVALVLLIGAWVVDTNLTRSRLGRALRSIRENEAVAQSFGVDVARHKLLAFTLSGTLAGVAGAVYGLTTYLVNSDTDAYRFAFSLTLVIMVVVGGLGSRAGVVIAALVFWIFPHFMDGLKIPYLGGTNQMIGAALLMYTVARHPGGFAEMARELREKRRMRAQPAAAGDAEDDTALPSLPRLPRPTSMGAAVARDDREPVLRVDGVTVRFGGLVAVDGASLEVRRGQIVGLIGPNGAGKTTLFNSISGVVRPTSGMVRMVGHDISALPAHQRAKLGLARTFQHIGLAKDQTVLENMLLAQHLLAGYDNASALLRTPRVERSEQEMSARAHAAITALGFEGREDTPVRLLSGGQQRIVEVGCVLLTDPELLMLDEPSAGMAPAMVENLAVRLRELRDELGRTVLLIEHNIPLVLDVCDYVYVLNFGQMLAQGSPDEILAHPDVVGAYLGETAA